MTKEQRPKNPPFAPLCKRGDLDGSSNYAHFEHSLHGYTIYDGLHNRRNDYKTKDNVEFNGR
jgi:hypothetical protein